jgi:hypothetical protein
VEYAGRIKKPLQGYPNTIYEESEYLITLLNKKGELVSQFKHTGSYKDVLISDKGNILVLTHFALDIYGSRSPVYLTFYDSKGNKLKETLEKFFGIAKMSKNGEFIAFTGVRVYYGEKVKGTPSLYIILFNRNGTISWKKEIGEFFWPVDIAISDNGNFIVASFTSIKKTEPLFQKTLFFNKNGEQTGSFGQAIGFIKMSSGDGKYTVGRDEEMFLFETKNGKLIYKGENVFPIDLTENIIVASSYYSDKIYFYNLKGEKLYELIYLGTGDVEGNLKNNGKRLLLNKKNDLKIFDINYEN